MRHGSETGRRAMAAPYFLDGSDGGESVTTTKQQYGKETGRPKIQTSYPAVCQGLLDCSRQDALLNLSPHAATLYAHCLLEGSSLMLRVVSIPGCI